MHKEQMTLDSIIRIYALNIILMVMHTYAGSQTLQNLASKGYHPITHKVSPIRA